MSNGASHHNKDDLSALSLACSVGSYDIVRLLMDEKAEIKVKDGRKKTPLMEAAEHNQPKIIKYLLDEAKVDIEARDEGKRTALLWAAERGNVEALQMLLENSANVDAKDEVRVRHSPHRTGWGRGFRPPAPPCRTD